MKVAIEIPYYSLGMRGPSQFGKNLVQALAKAFPDDRFVVFNYFRVNYETHRARIASKLSAPNIELVLPRWSQRLVDFAERRLGHPFVENRFLSSSGADVFDITRPHPVGASRTPLVYFLHGAPMDLIRIDPSMEREVLAQVLRAAQVPVLSRCIRDFVLKHYPIDSKKLSVVYYGVDHSLFRPINARAALEAVRRRYSLPERFLLSVGPFQFRDNVEHLLWALHALRGHPRLKDMRLVLAGGPEEHGDVLTRRVKALGLEDRVVFPGYIPHEDLAAVYNLAAVFVHSSFYEELGAQLLEACACGVPILASNAGGIPEAAGDAPVYFNPHLSEEFQESLLRVLESADLRAEMGAKALEWSRKFSWETTARQMMDIYRTAAERRS